MNKKVLILLNTLKWIFLFCLSPVLYVWGKYVFFGMVGLIMLIKEIEKEASEDGNRRFD